MFTIHKFILEEPIRPVYHIPMHAGAHMMDVQVQGDLIVMWALVNTDRQQVIRAFYIKGTGHAIGGTSPETAKADYVGTVQRDPYVWHVFASPNE